MSKMILDGFQENRFFSIFEKFFGWSATQKYRNLPFWLQKGIKKYKIVCKHIWALSEKNISRQVVDIAEKSIFEFQTTIMRFQPKNHNYRFRPLKALKFQKFFDFRNVFIFCYISIFYGFFISLVVKKLQRFEGPSIQIYLPLDDCITCIFFIFGSDSHTFGSLLWV